MNRGALWRLSTVYTTFVGRIVIGVILLACLVPNVLVLLFTVEDRAHTVRVCLMITSALAAGFLWLAAAPGCVQLMRSARQLVCPALQRFAGLALALLAALTIALPSAAMAAAHGPWAWCAVVLTCIAGLVLVFTLVPFLVFIFGFIGLSQLLNGRDFKLLAATQLAPGASDAVLWLGSAALVLAGIAWQRARVLVARPDAICGLNGSLLELAAVGRGDPGDQATQSAALSSGSAWLHPRPGTHRSPGQSIRFLIGPPLLPGVRQQLLQLSPMLLIPVFALTMSMPAALNAVTSLLILTLPLASLQRHGLLYRAQSGELAELALLPGLGSQRARFAAYCQGLFITSAISVLVVFGMVAIAGWLLGLARPPIASAIGALAVLVLSAAYVLGRGRQAPINRNPFIALLFYGPVAVVVIMLDHAGTPRPALAILGMLAAVSLTACAIVVWRHVRKAQQLPHPFLVEADR